MKKLCKISTIALVLLGFFATSCEKETPAPPAPAPMVMKTSTTFTPKGTTTPKTIKGDIEDGERGVTYVIQPVLNVCDCIGTWSFSMAPVNNPAYSHVMNPKTGAISFTAGISGTYVFTITFKCPNGSSVSTTVSITIK